MNRRLGLGALVVGGLGLTLGAGPILERTAPELVRVLPTVHLSGSEDTTITVRADGNAPDAEILLKLPGKERIEKISGVHLPFQRKIIISADDLYGARGNVAMSVRLAHSGPVTCSVEHEATALDHQTNTTGVASCVGRVPHPRNSDTSRPRTGRRWWSAGG